MNTIRQHIRTLIMDIVPLDETETLHRKEALDWIDSTTALFRLKSPDVPPKHLVSYFVLYDEATNLIMLIDHVKARLWLPTGGHVEPDENPRTTITREAEEELKIDADFSTRFNDQPLFLTVTTTRGFGTHIDVSLWYIIKGDSTQELDYDTREMNGYRWLSPVEILTTDIAELDPHMHRFVQKLQRRI